jgi:phosphate transport system substrate-binding protein
VGNESEPSQREDLKKIRLALVECTKCTEKDLFAKPSQSTITFGQYPLIRPLFYILKENWTGLGSGFMNFMSLERGQLIFRRSGLAPAKMSFLKRTSKIQE